VLVDGAVGGDPGGRFLGILERDIGFGDVFFAIDAGFVE
jgi:hypothetical protein